jgi:AraC family transcriptional regulator of adaptative response / DNA-3-methyladenine glycosylase II
MSRRSATVLAAVADAMAMERLRLGPGCDVTEAESALRQLGVSRHLALRIILRALHWPDALPETDPELVHSSGMASPDALLQRADQWRPWRAYAAVHLWLAGNAGHQLRRRSQAGAHEGMVPAS